MSVKKQLSKAQKQALLEYIDSNPKIVIQKHTNQHTAADSRKMWEEVAEKLNAIPGVIKNWQYWRKVSKHSSISGSFCNAGRNQ